MWIMSSHVLVGLFGPTQATEESTPTKDATGGTKAKAPKLGFLRLLKLVFVAVVLAGVGIGVWFFQPIPMVIAMFHSVASQTSIPAVFDRTGSSATGAGTHRWPCGGATGRPSSAIPHRTGGHTDTALQLRRRGRRSAKAHHSEEARRHHRRD